jgi:hypothetical protein
MFIQDMQLKRSRKTEIEPPRSDCYLLVKILPLGHICEESMALFGRILYWLQTVDSTSAQCRLPWTQIEQVPLKCWYISTKLHSSTPQKIASYCSPMWESHITHREQAVTPVCPHATLHLAGLPGVPYLHSLQCHLLLKQRISVHANGIRTWSRP